MTRLNHYRAVLVGLALLDGESPSAALPPPLPPETSARAEDARLYLEVLVNLRPSGLVVAVDRHQGRFRVDAADLRALGLPVTREGPLDLAELAEVEMRYDVANQRLLLQVPAHWLPQQHLQHAAPRTRMPARSSFGALLDYQMYASAPRHGQGIHSAWTDLRLFGDFGVFSHSGVYQRPFGGSAQRSRYLRYDSGWRYTDEERALTYEIGDLVSRTQSWATPVRLGGVQLSRDFAIRPDIVTYPLPRFSGEAALPSTLDLFIDGYRNSSYPLQPGPFSIGGLPYISGAGQAVLQTTDALGRQVSTSVPFYVSSDLLRPGLSDFAFSLGSLRQGYGEDDFAYGAGAASASLRHGLSDYFTLQAQAEGAAGLAMGGVGGVLRLGTLGVLNAAASHGRLDGDGGRQFSFGYQYSARRLSLSAQRSQRDADYRDLAHLAQERRWRGTPGEADERRRRYAPSRRSTQATASLALDDWGSLGTGYFEVESGDGSRTRLLNLSWSRSLWGGASLYLSANRELGSGRWSSVVQLAVPFDLRGTLSLGVERNASGRGSQRVDYSASAPSEGGFGWNLGYVDNGGADDWRQAALSWRGDRLLLQGGVYGSAREQTRWADASGSLAWMDGALFPANRVHDAFVLVSTDGQAGVPVRYENQLVGHTNADGHLLVPWSSAYYPGKYEIDPLGLASNVVAPLVEQRVAVRAGSGYLLRFPVHRVLSASLLLHDRHGQPLPLGAQARVNGGAPVLVGWDGLVYLEQLQAHNSLNVTLPDGGTCGVRFELDPQATELVLLGPLPCR
ncbi:fimbria/pilus outer membrane usher protein [Pseudomonas citronellolis]|uniref:fimbria/pilus outer membrane usher protein n=1 Tax=Pseudomonas citronellolis TaxID=53408 RepID=UPI0023E386A5|nr:fimbria/pilus outer membrane usher protein [Pseudomonas citronellolis]MDF3932321.1 fimbria/pilus outer membrane usher protein [Pseudomonas citronellolis]